MIGQFVTVGGCQVRVEAAPSHYPKDSVLLRLAVDTRYAEVVLAPDDQVRLIEKITEVGHV